MYDSDSGTVTTALHDANPTVFSETTIDQILALTTNTNTSKVVINSTTPDADGNVTVPAGDAGVVFVTTSDTMQTTVKAPVNAPVVIFQGSGGIAVTLNDGPSTVPAHAFGVVDRVVVGTAGNDQIVVADSKNTKVILGTGDSSVTTGAGHDTVVAGHGNASIDGGTGHAIVQLNGNATDYTVRAVDGHAMITSNDNHSLDLTHIQFVALDNNHAMVLASNETDAQVASLYHAAFGRDADGGGLQYWFDLAHAGASLIQIATAFTHSVEFASVAAETDTQFIQGLYQNVFGRAGEDDGVAYWVSALSAGHSRAEIIASFSEIATQNIEHTAANQEAQVIGSVTIVTGIV